MNNSHWLTISTINCLRGRGNIYDSLVGKNVTLDTKVQIARLLHTPLPEITLHVMNIEQQSNGSDCGLCVIATALEVCAGNDPTTGSEKMRPHLEKCLKLKGDRRTRDTQNRKNKAILLLQTAWVPLGKKGFVLLMWGVVSSTVRWHPNKLYHSISRFYVPHLHCTISYMLLVHDNRFEICHKLRSLRVAAWDQPGCVELQ